MNKIKKLTLAGMVLSSLGFSSCIYPDSDNSKKDYGLNSICERCEYIGVKSNIQLPPFYEGSNIQLPPLKEKSNLVLPSLKVRQNYEINVCDGGLVLPGGVRIFSRAENDTPSVVENSYDCRRQTGEGGAVGTKIGGEGGSVGGEISGQK